MAKKNQDIPSLTFALKYETAAALCNLLSAQKVHGQRILDEEGSRALLEDYQSLEQFHIHLIVYLDKYC